MYPDLRRKSLARYVVDPDTGCHVWTGATNERGYGIVKWDGRRQRVHRITYESAKGPIPEGFEIDHLCRNHSCINPAHLEAVPGSVNVRRGLSAKLNESDVRRIRQLRIENGASLGALARTFGITKTSVARIIAGKTWTDVPDGTQPSSESASTNSHPLRVTRRGQPCTLTAATHQDSWRVQP